VNNINLECMQAARILTATHDSVRLIIGQQFAATRPTSPDLAWIKPEF
jgi:hypothetical protein